VKVILFPSGAIFFFKTVYTGCTTHPASQSMGIEGKVTWGVKLTTHHSLPRLRMSAALPPHRPMPSMCAQDKKILNFIPAVRRISAFACLQTPSRISCNYKRCGLFVSGGFRVAHYVCGGVMLSAPSLLYNGYRLSFPAASGQDVALTTHPLPPYRADVTGRVELYLYSPSEPSWLVLE